MTPFESLRKKILAVDSRDYGAYQSIKGVYEHPEFNLFIDQIPKDPYAPPHTGIYRIQVQRNDPKVIGFQTEDAIENIAFRDFLTRAFNSACQDISQGRRGTGNSGLITISQPGQAILDRSCIIVTDDVIEVRCFVGLPAAGRKIKAEVATTMLFEELPEIVRRSLYQENINPEKLSQHIKATVDAESLRSQLEIAGLVAFIADGAILPRKSGTSDEPLTGNETVLFVSPENLKVEFKLPHAGAISGMGIKQGVSLIVGGGYHGKSTLLDAMAAGIYNHIPGDGRELCVSLSQTVKVRAYSGRSIEKTDISPFIRNLPFQKDTSAFCTENASGSTSQAANIIEAIEIGARLFLMDEDTCATNFMIRDKKMQELVNKMDEPITAFIDKVRQLYTEKGISTILVLGGAGDYFEVSDQVVQMIRYEAKDVTEKTRQIALASPGKRTPEDTDYPISPRQRNPIGASVSSFNDHGKKSIYAKEIYRFVFGGETVDLTDVEQIVELTQTKTIAQALDYAKRYMDNQTSLREIVERVSGDVEEKGLDILSDRISGHYAQFRSFELAFALNRLRGFEVIQQPD